MPDTTALKHLNDLWDQRTADELGGNQLSLLRYRSNLLGADLRITNFGGGNTSSKIDLPDPFTGAPVRVMAVKGSGGDLGSITDAGFALLYLDKLEQLKSRYRGEAFEDEMVEYYPLSAFGHNRVAASIDTPLHAFIPAPHVDHLHPDWAIALAASANGRRKLDEFNRQFGRRIIWVPWQRPGFELALMIEAALRDNPGSGRGDSRQPRPVHVGRHAARVLSEQHAHDRSDGRVHRRTSRRRQTPLFGGRAHEPIDDRHEMAARILPALRGAVSSNRRVIAHFTDSQEALGLRRVALGERRSAGSARAVPITFCARASARSSSSGIQPPATSEALTAAIRAQVGGYRDDYQRYYESLRHARFSEAARLEPVGRHRPWTRAVRLRQEQEGSADHHRVLPQRHQRDGRRDGARGSDGDGPLPQARRRSSSHQFEQFHNYVALPRSEAFRIEYWALEEAKLQRMPAEAEFSRKIALVVGGGSGIGREVALLLARKGAHVVVADADAESAAARGGRSRGHCVARVGGRHRRGPELGRKPDRALPRLRPCSFGGIDAIVNTAAIYPVADPTGRLTDAQWAKTFLVNVTGNYLLAQQTEWIFREQQLPGAMVLTGSANAVVPKKGSEAYDTSKSAVNHLIRELAIGLAPLVRVNGIAPATVVAGSTMFPRDRVMQSLRKYDDPVRRVRLHRGPCAASSRSSTRSAR